MNISQENSQALKNPWVLGLLVFLLVFLSANALFIYLAFKSPPNLVIEDFYEKGQAYAKTEEEIIREKNLGWSGILLTPSASRVNQTQTYEAVITGQNSAGLLLDSVKFFAYRPSDKRQDFSADMQPSGHGSFVTDVSFHLPGSWDIIIEARRGEDKYVLTRRIQINP
ncbi:FixH family protein [Methylophaga sulfidovorans]|uniref:Nitrogen fixation protein FixH n=1 Tax=Methylophaga sulfidovorans TaxID=45496 RepID=A0A1I3US73_9GAMM|nr:FixH family protein [Methylophaga sulfidovorans]SFJ85589.1 Nitrogen fixation protein FixH [Methylophaga sulfidovorans]